MMEISQNIKITGVWKKLIPTVMDDFEVFKTSLEEITAGAIETARELQLHVKCKMELNCCNLLITNEQRFEFYG